MEATPNLAPTVVVRGFDADHVSEDDLREFMSSVGDVRSVKILLVKKNIEGRRRWAFAFVDYLTEDAAARAVAEFNDAPLGTRSQEVYTLRVRRKFEKSRVGGHGGGGSGFSTPPKAPTQVEAALGDLSIGTPLAADAGMTWQQRELLVDSERSSASSSASTATGSQPMAACVATWDAHDVSAFCKGFGLPDEVCKNFVDNCVDGAMLAEITNDELINEIGMTKLQVKRLRRELMALHGGE
jgi:RNA recognition motif-containing protein